MTTINEDTDFKHEEVGSSGSGESYERHYFTLYKNNQSIVPVLANTYQFGDYAVLGVNNQNSRIYSEYANNARGWDLLAKYKGTTTFYGHRYEVDRQDVDQRTLPSFEGNYIKFLKDGLYLVELFYMMYKYYNVNIGSTMVFPNRNDIYTKFTNENELTLINREITDVPGSTDYGVVLKKGFPMIAVIEVKNGNLKLMPEFTPKLDFKLKVKKGNREVIKTYPFTYNRAKVDTNDNMTFYGDIKLKFDFTDFVKIENNTAVTKLIQTVQAEDWWGNNNDVFYKLMLGQLCVYKIK